MHCLTLNETPQSVRKSGNTCQAAQCHIPGVKKKSSFFSIFTNSNQIQELVTLLIPMKTYGYLKSTFSKVWLHHINQSKTEDSPSSNFYQ